MRRISVICLVAILVAGSAARATTPAPVIDGEWIRVDTPHFTLLSSAGGTRTIDIGRNLERLRETLAGSAPGLKLHSPLPTTIYVFRDTEEFAPYNLGDDGEPEELAGYFLRTPDGNYVAIDASVSGPARDSVIYHEYLHYVMENSVPGLPLWLSEGYAEFYSSFRIVDGTAELGRPIADHLRWLATHRMIPLRELMHIDTSSESYNEGTRQSTFYAQSWALTHYLVSDEPRRERMGRFLDAIARGDAPLIAFEKTYGMDLATLERELTEYVREASYEHFTFEAVRPERRSDETEVSTRPMPRGELLFRLGDLLAHHPPVQFEQAEAHLHAALKLDGRHAHATLTLAFLQLIREQPLRAAELCRKALELDADNARGHALYGMSLFDQYALTMTEDDLLLEGTPPLLLAARAEFRESLRLAPDHAESLIGLGKTYLFERGDVKEGLDALTRASAAHPGRADILADRIVLTARSGNVAGAQALLDRNLRPRGQADLIQLAEAGLIEVGLSRAESLFADGRDDEARALVQRLSEQTRDPELKRSLASELITLSRLIEDNAAIELFNRAVSAIHTGEFDQATTLLRRVVDSAVNDELRAEAASHLTEIGRALDKAQSER